jgi:hypothetical protein
MSAQDRGTQRGFHKDNIDREDINFLVESTTGALATARAALSDAARFAGRIEGVLRSGEAEFADLSALGNPPDPAHWHAHSDLRSASGRADDLNRFVLTDGELRLQRIRHALNASSDALEAAELAYHQLETVPGRPFTAMDDLRSRLDDLTRAVDAGRERVGAVGIRLASARRNIEPLLHPSNEPRSPAQVTALINGTSSVVAGDIADSLEAVKELRDGFGQDAGARSAHLTESTAAALATAHAALSDAALAADSVERTLSAGNVDVAALSALADPRGSVPRNAADSLRLAHEWASNIDDFTLRPGALELQRMEKALAGATGALEAARRPHADLERTPGSSVEATDELRSRLEGLSRAVASAQEGTAEVRERLDSGRQTIRALVQPSPPLRDPQQIADAIRGTGEIMTGQLAVSSDLLKRMSKNLAAGRSGPLSASAELADIAWAGLTPPAASRTSGSAVADTRGWTGKSARGSANER